MSYFTTNTWAAALLALIVVALGWGLMRRNKLVSSAIDLDDLLLGEDGKLSKAAAVMMGAFVLTSWIMIKLTLTDKLTEGYFMAFLGAWVAPTVTRLIVNRPQ